MGIQHTHTHTHTLHPLFFLSPHIYTHCKQKQENNTSLKNKNVLTKRQHSYTLDYNYPESPSVLHLTTEIEIHLGNNKPITSSRQSLKVQVQMFVLLSGLLSLTMISIKTPVSKTEIYILLQVTVGFCHLNCIP